MSNHRTFTELSKLGQVTYELSNIISTAESKTLKQENMELRAENKRLREYVEERERFVRENFVTVHELDKAQEGNRKYYNYVCKIWNRFPFLYRDEDRICISDC